MEMVRRRAPPPPPLLIETSLDFLANKGTILTFLQALPHRRPVHARLGRLVDLHHGPLHHANQEPPPAPGLVQREG